MFKKSSLENISFEGNAVDITDQAISCLRDFQPKNNLENKDVFVEKIDSIFDNGFYVERIQVSGDLWKSTEKLRKLRGLLVEELIDTFEIQQNNSNGIIPAEECAKCHVKQFHGWKIANLHSNAWKSLEQLQMTRNVFCVRCHTTQLPTEAYRSVDFKINPIFANVQCVACHQISHGTHQSNCQMKAFNPTLSVCNECHRSRGPIVDLQSKIAHLGCCQQKAK